MADIIETNPGVNVVRETGGGMSAVAWPAILAGSAAAVALSSALFVLGSGLGFAALPQAAGAEHPAAALTAGVAAWLVVTQWASAGLGGYLTGRLRTKWLQTDADEVFFRDTAHGFLAWCVGTVFVAAFAAAAAGAAAADKAVPGGQDGAFAYYADSLLRGREATEENQDGAEFMPNRAAPGRGVHEEAARILMRAAGDGRMAEADKAYLAARVSERTGLAGAGAARRVDDVMTRIGEAGARAAEAAETARRTAATLSILTALSMFVGAFIACIAAALGGRCRDAA